MENSIFANNVRFNIQDGTKVYNLKFLQMTSPPKQYDELKLNLVGDIRAI